ncbi:MAG: DUF5615 family PIN-like protein [Flavobacteriales bacterium]|nr:DUF5615 family PIN-like protein [Flavobacteriales bacterium]
MKLLFDQNISHRLAHKLKAVFSNCSQVRIEGLENATDIEIWQYAKENKFSIVTFDIDFYDLATLKGHPPKIIWLRIGNTATSNLQKVLTNYSKSISEFISSEECKELSCLEIIEIE